MDKRMWEWIDRANKILVVHGIEPMGAEMQWNEAVITLCKTLIQLTSGDDDLPEPQAIANAYRRMK